MVNLLFFEFAFVVAFLGFVILFYLIRSTRFKRLTNDRLKILFDVSKQFSRQKDVVPLAEVVLKHFVDTLSAVSYGGIIICDEDELDCVKFYDIKKGFVSVDITEGFVNRIKSSKLYFSIEGEEKLLNYSFLDRGSKKYPYYHVLKFYVDDHVFGAFVFGSKKGKIDVYEYEFFRIFIEHFAFGLQNKYLAKQVTHFSKTIDILENTYQHIVDYLPVGVVCVNNSEGYPVLLWNDLMEQMFSFSANEMVDASVLNMFLRDKNKDIISNLLKKTMDSKSIQEISNLHYISRKDEEKHFLVLCYLLRDYESGFDGSVLVFRDITERVKLESDLQRAQNIKEDDMRLKIDDATKELQHANVELKNLNNVKSEFVSIVSHELRTPLTSIRGYASLLKSGRLGTVTEQQKESLGVIAEEGERLSNLINDLLDLSKLQAGKVNLQIEEHNVVETVMHSLKTLNIQADAKKIVLKKTGKKSLKLYYDVEKMNRVLYNIIGNAIKFTPKEGHVSVRVSEEKDFGVISVIDTGIGIPKKQIEKIFEPFSQVENSLQRQAGGTGLGLTISRHIMELHHGTLEVESSVKKGTTFKIRIPKNLCVLEPKAMSNS